MFLILCISVAALAYVYIGYPLLLDLLLLVRGPRPVGKKDITPSVSFIISAYNELPVIRQKLDNTLALDYPRDRLTPIVISDASEDGTDEVVRGYADRGVVLHREAARAGKTAGLNAALASVTSEIVVFSDANAMYKRNALRKLVRNFADPAVGCVTGEARYLTGNRKIADIGERAYWDYEIKIKRLETAVGSMVGGDGAIYAIRRGLWRALPENAINDFLNPLQIVEIRLARSLRARGHLSRRDGWGHPAGVAAADSDRQPELAGRISGARRSQSVSRRTVRPLGDIAQSAPLVFWTVPRWGLDSGREPDAGDAGRRDPARSRSRCRCGGCGDVQGRTVRRGGSLVFRGDQRRLARRSHQGKPRTGIGHVDDTAHSPQIRPELPRRTRRRTCLWVPFCSAAFLRSS